MPNFVLFIFFPKSLNTSRVDDTGVQRVNDGKNFADDDGRARRRVPPKCFAFASRESRCRPEVDGTTHTVRGAGIIIIIT